MSTPVPEDPRRVGFNDEARHGQRRFHVQTEVLGHSRKTVRSTVLESGIVRFTESRPCPADAREPGQVRAFVEAQHARILGLVSRGEIE